MKCLVCNKNHKTKDCPLSVSDYVVATELEDEDIVIAAPHPMSSPPKVAPTPPHKIAVPMLLEELDQQTQLEASLPKTVPPSNLRSSAPPLSKPVNQPQGVQNQHPSTPVPYISTNSQGVTFTTTTRSARLRNRLFLVALGATPVIIVLAIFAVIGLRLGFMAAVGRAEFIQFTTEPAGAVVLENGKVVCHTPCSIPHFSTDSFPRDFKIAKTAFGEQDIRVYSPGSQAVIALTGGEKPNTLAASSPAPAVEEVLVEEANLEEEEGQPEVLQEPSAEEPAPKDPTLEPQPSELTNEKPPLPLQEPVIEEPAEVSEPEPSAPANEPEVAVATPTPKSAPAFDASAFSGKFSGTRAGRQFHMALKFAPGGVLNGASKHFLGPNPEQSRLAGTWKKDGSKITFTLKRVGTNETYAGFATQSTVSGNWLVNGKSKGTFTVSR